MDQLTCKDHTLLQSECYVKKNKKNEKNILIKR